MKTTRPVGIIQEASGAETVMAPELANRS